MENKQRQNEEVDVFELFRYIGKAFNKLGNLLLRFFNFLMRNVIIIGILLVVGIVAGYILDRNLPESLRTSATVVTGYDSSAYLYKFVDEIDAQLMAGDEGLLARLGLTEEEAGKISIEVGPIIGVERISEEEVAFMELLAENESLSQAQKQDILNRGYPQHRITLFHPETVRSKELLEQMILHMRDNTHFQKIFSQNKLSIEQEIQGNLFVLEQIDTLLHNYAQSVGKKNVSSEALVFSENSMDLGEVLKQKISLQNQTRALQIEKVENQTFLSIVDMGTMSTAESRTLWNKKMFLVPLLLIGSFLLVHLFLRIYHKSRQLNK